MIAKRIWFALTVTLLLTIIATPSFAQPSAEQEPAVQPVRSGSNGTEQKKDAIAGSWQLVINMINPPPGVPAEFRALETLTEDGFVLSSMSLNPLIAGPAHGEWRHEGGRLFSQTCFFYIFDALGNHNLTIRLRSQLTLNESGDQHSALYKLDFLMPDGTLLFTGTATGIGKRFSSVPF